MREPERSAPRTPNIACSRNPNRYRSAKDQLGGARPGRVGPARLCRGERRPGGGGTSEGTGDLFSDEEAQDYYDLIEWAGVQPWSNGRVGLGRRLLPLHEPIQGRGAGSAHLAAICPMGGVQRPLSRLRSAGRFAEDGFSAI